MSRVLVTGGAGYIGSHTCKELARAGHEPVTLDDLSTGHSWAVKWGPLVEADLADRDRVQTVIREQGIETVLHFAAHAYVGESMREPRRYFRNNVANTLNLLDAMLDSDVATIVFSSSCATYGIPSVVPITEEAEQRPVNAYGESKLMVERILKWYGKAYGLRWIGLRYFNAAGADPDGELGEVHEPEPHVLPLAIRAGLGQEPTFRIFGTDYPTPDGTAIRDYIHVTDLAHAHACALNYLAMDKASTCFNIGTGVGHSVREVISAVEEATGNSVPIVEARRRDGDAPVLVADGSRAVRDLGWTATHSSLNEIVETARRWHDHANQSK